MNKANSKITFRRKLRARNCTSDFGLGPGVLVTDQITYTVPENPLNPGNGNSLVLARQIMQDNQALVKNYIEVVMEEIK